MNGDKISDLSGKGNDANMEGDLKLEEGKFGKALQFGGSVANKLTVKHDLALNPEDGEITLMAWMYLEQVADDWDLIILKWQDEAPPAFTFNVENL